MGSVNVFVGISLKNKSLDSEKIQNIVQTAEREFNATKILFLIADQLELINFRIFEEGSDKTGRKVNSKIVNSLSKLINESLSTSHLPYLIDTWDSIQNRFYWNTYIEIFHLFCTNQKLRNDLKNIAIQYSKKRSSSISNSELHYLSTYLLAELPTLIRGIRHKNQLYDKMIYPSPSQAYIDEIAESIISEEYGEFQIASEELCEIIKVKG